MYNYGRICRICTLTFPKLICMGSKNEDGITYFEMASLCTGIEMSVYDTLPHFLCVFCIKKLKDIHKFQELAKESHQQFLKHAHIVTTKISKKNETNEAVSNITEKCVKDKTEKSKCRNGGEDSDKSKDDDLQLQNNHNVADDRYIFMSYVHLVKEPVNDSTLASNKKVIDKIESKDIGSRVVDNESHVVNVTDSSHRKDPTSELDIIENEDITKKSVNDKTNACENLLNLIDAELATRKEVPPSSNPLIACALCFQCFLKETDLIDHRLKTHRYYFPSVHSRTCKYCMKIFLSASEVEPHVLEVHKSHLTFVCGYCGFKYFVENSLKHHFDLHIANREHQRKVCVVSQSEINSWFPVLKNRILNNSGETANTEEMCKPNTDLSKPSSVVSVTNEISVVDSAVKLVEDKNENTDKCVNLSVICSSKKTNNSKSVEKHNDYDGHKNMNTDKITVPNATISKVTPVVCTLNKNTTKNIDPNAIISNVPPAVCTLNKNTTKNIDPNAIISNVPPAVCTFNKNTTKNIDTNAITSKVTPVVCTLNKNTTKNVVPITIMSKLTPVICTLNKNTTKNIDPNTILSNVPPAVCTLNKNTTKNIDPNTILSNIPQAVCTLNKNTTKNIDPNTILSNIPQAVCTLNKNTTKNIDPNAIISNVPPAVCTLNKNTTKNYENKDNVDKNEYREKKIVPLADISKLTPVFRISKKKILTSAVENANIVKNYETKDNVDKNEYREKKIVPLADISKLTPVFRISKKKILTSAVENAKIVKNYETKDNVDKNEYREKKIVPLADISKLTPVFRISKKKILTSAVENAKIVKNDENKDNVDKNEYKEKKIVPLADISTLTPVIRISKKNNLTSGVKNAKFVRVIVHSKEKQNAILQHSEVSSKSINPYSLHNLIKAAEQNIIKNLDESSSSRETTESNVKPVLATCIKNSMNDKSPVPKAYPLILKKNEKPWRFANFPSIIKKPLIESTSSPDIIQKPQKRTRKATLITRDENISSEMIQTDLAQSNVETVSYQQDKFDIVSNKQANVDTVPYKQANVDTVPCKQANVDTVPYKQGNESRIKNKHSMIVDLIAAEKTSLKSNKYEIVTKRKIHPSLDPVIILSKINPLYCNESRNTDGKIKPNNEELSSAKRAKLTDPLPEALFDFVKVEPSDNCEDYSDDSVLFDAKTEDPLEMATE